MANKSKEEKQAVSKTSEDSAQVLGQLREIVFGHAERELKDSIDGLRTDMQAQFSSLKQHYDTLNHKLKTQIEQLHADLAEQISHSHSHHEEQEEKLGAELDKAIKRLSSDIEMAESAGKDDAEQLHARLDGEVRELTSQFNQQFEQTLAKLDAVTQELSSTKTDRKTLAKLLATMAVNLEADDTQDQSD